jgi:hypothetical protein
MVITTFGDENKLRLLRTTACPASQIEVTCSAASCSRAAAILIEASDGGATGVLARPSELLAVLSIVTFSVEER